MNGPDITRLILIANVAILIVYDVVALWKWGSPATISVVAYEEIRQHPLIGIGVGVVIGHIWFPIHGK